jgi:hypothetical protein
MTGILWAVLQEPLVVQPLYPEGSPHHITLQYGVEREAWGDIIGLPMTVGALELCHNDRIQAIRVALPTWALCQNPNPHITVSWVPGAQPVEANAMLNAPHHSEPMTIPIHTMIEFLEWGEPEKPTCSVCRVTPLGKNNKTGVCSRCQRNRQPNARYRKPRP